MDKYKYQIELGVLRNSKRRNLKLQRFFRNNIFTYNNILNYLEINNKPFALSSKELNKATEKISWDCPIHGEFSMSWNTVKNGQGCPVCGDEKSITKRSNSYEYIKNEFTKRNLTLISKSYTNNLGKLQFICNNHKDKGIQEITYASLIDVEGCKYCNYENGALSKTKTHDEFCAEIKALYGDKYIILSKYINAKEDVTVYCNDCKDTFPARPDHLLNNHGCPTCSSSKGEKRVDSFLKENEIEYEPQCKFEDCKYIRKLPFDFYLPKYNLCIEYQGIQHYQPIEIFGGQKQYEKQQMYDEIKRRYCFDINIKLIEISYKDFENIEDILSKVLNL
jgi:hypothetical protein